MTTENQAQTVEDLMTKIQAFGLACYQHESGDLQKEMQAEIRAALTGAIQAPEGAQAKNWEGAEEWMPLAWELCANENGEEACTELIWEGGPIPEPWGDRWLKYEDQAKEMIAMVRKHVRPQPDVKGTAAKPIGVEVVGVVRPGGEEGPNVEWLLEGGLHAVAEGGEAYLLVSHEPITNDDGYGEVVRVNRED